MKVVFSSSVNGVAFSSLRFGDTFFTQDPKAVLMKIQPHEGTGDTVLNCVSLVGARLFHVPSTEIVQPVDGSFIVGVK